MKKQLFHNTFVVIAMLFAILFLPITVRAQVMEAYAVMDTDAKTFSFYYDSNKDSYDENTVYTLPNSITGYPEWCLKYDRKKITTVIFDNSMKNCYPTSTRLWFDGFEKLTTIEGIKNLNTDNVTNMGGMFSGCKVLTSIDVSGFRTQNVTYMDYMFDGCELLKTIDVSHFDTKSVTNMSFMFYGCKSLISVDVSNFNTQLVTNISDMFHNCESLTTIYCNDIWTCEMSICMFQDCKLLKGGENGSVVYDANKIDIAMANPTTGYFTRKTPDRIEMQTIENEISHKQIYTLQGIRLDNISNFSGRGIFILKGKKLLKR